MPFFLIQIRNPPSLRNMGCFTVLKSKKKKIDRPPSSTTKHVPPHHHSPAILPEPQTNNRRSLQSAPPSFRTRAKPTIQLGTSSVRSNRTRALSAPSTLDEVAKNDAFSSNACLDQEHASKARFGSSKDYISSPNPQPLPLPSPSSALRATASFKMNSNNGGNLDMSGPLPLPPVKPSTVLTKGAVRNFSYEEIASACHNFSPERCVSEGLSSVLYRACFEDVPGSGPKRNLDATVTRLHPSKQGFKEFVGAVNTLASLQHPFLCKLIGFHAKEGSDQRMLVFERLYHGSLDRLLYGRTDGPPLDWNSRMKVALCAAQGLTFLHEEGPFQAMFYEFSTANIQIDKDFSAMLSGYGCISHVPETDISSNSAAVAYLSVETIERGLLTPKSNVWSFGIVLLELLTGRKNLDSRLLREERNLVKWSKPYLSDDSRLSLIIDPQLKGRFPPKAARAIVDIAQKCLQPDPSERPTMRTIADHLKSVQDMKFASRFPLQDPCSVKGKNMGRSISLNGIVHPAPPRSNLSTGNKTHASSNAIAVPLALPPPRTCSSTLAFGEVDEREGRRSSSSTFHRYSVEGV